MRKLSQWLVGSGVFLLCMGLWGGHLVTGWAAQTTSAVPTLFFHGYGSSTGAEDQMARAAEKAGVTRTVVKLTVNRWGRASLNKRILKDTRNPIVEVSFMDNTNTDYQRDGEYAARAVALVEKETGSRAVNLVGHSMGNLAIANYLLATAKSDRAPRVNHLVAIAGHYAGLRGYDTTGPLTVNAQGRPNRENNSFKDLLPLRQDFPKQTAVLNIYGDVGDGSDGRVENASSQSLKYLVGPRAKSYREVKITGKQAQHSRLHENQEVDRLMINFLWR